MLKEKKIYWKLSQNQHTLAGNALMHIYYDTDLVQVLDEKSGYPHNGGEHSLTVFCTKSYLEDWLDLVQSEMGELAKPFIVAAESKILKRTRGVK